jgi:lysophospholipase L1-like esterase
VSAGARRRLGRLLLALFSAAFGLKLADVAVGYFDPMGISHFSNLGRFNEECTEYKNIGPPGHSFGMRFPIAGRTCVTNVEYRINALGFRGREYAEKKPEGAFRLVVLGDSVTFGWGVPVADRFTDVVERTIGATLPAGRTFEILNLAVPGYETKEQAHAFRYRAMHLEPDAVVVVFNQNDVQNDTDETLDLEVLYRERAGQKTILAPLFVAEPWRDVLDATLPNLRLLGIYHYVFAVNEQDHRILRERYAAMTNGVNISLLLLADMHEKASRAGVRFGVCDMHQFEPVRSGLEARGVPVREIGLGVPLNDPDLRNSAADPHPNSRGHALLARDFAIALREMELLPAAEAR